MLHYTWKSIIYIYRYIYINQSRIPMFIPLSSSKLPRSAGRMERASRLLQCPDWPVGAKPTCTWPWQSWALKRWIAVSCSRSMQPGLVFVLSEFVFVVYLCCSMLWAGEWWTCEVPCGWPQPSSSLCSELSVQHCSLDLRVSEWLPNRWWISFQCIHQCCLYEMRKSLPRGRGHAFADTTILGDLRLCWGWGPGEKASWAWVRMNFKWMW